MMVRYQKQGGILLCIFLKANSMLTMLDPNKNVETTHKQLNIMKVFLLVVRHDSIAWKLHDTLRCCFNCLEFKYEQPR